MRPQEGDSRSRTAEEQRPHALNKKVTRWACRSQTAARGRATGISHVLPSRSRTPKQERRKLLRTQERLKVTRLFKKFDPGICLTK